MARIRVPGMLLGLLLAGCGSSAAAGPAGLGSRGGRPVRVYRIPSGAMEPTLKIGDRVSVRPGAPAVGAIVVYHPPQGIERELCGPRPHVVRPGGRGCAAPVPREDRTITLVKRIVAGPGDRLYVRAGHVYRQAGGRGRFVRESDSYTRACGAAPECDFPVPVTVPAGSWYLLGDNRGESLDSRSVGAIPTAWITGVVTAIAPRPAPATDPSP